MERPSPTLVLTQVGCAPTCPLANSSVQSFSLAFFPNCLSYARLSAPPLCPLKNVMSPHLWSL